MVENPCREHVLDERWYEADGLDEVEPLLQEEVGEAGRLSRAWATIRRKPDDYLNDRRLYRQAKEEWWGMQREDIEPSEPDDLPGYDIEIDDTVYHVRGVAHGGSRMFKASDDVKEYVGEKVEDYASEGHSVRVEEMIPKAMDFEEAVENSENVREMDDLQWALEEDTYGMIKSTISSLPKALIALPFIKAAQTSDSDSRGSDFIETMSDSLEDVSHWEDLFNAVEANTMPYDIEEDFMSEYSPTRHLITNERSLYQATSAVASNENEQYLVVGMGHVPHIGEKLEDFDGGCLPLRYSR